jgi:hypothetical protein
MSAKVVTSYVINVKSSKKGRLYSADIKTDNEKDTVRYRKVLPTKVSTKSRQHSTHTLKQLSQHSTLLTHVDTFV